MAAGMLSLLIGGGGLPMNPFPPPRLVRSGAYAVLAHPIYTGFVMLSAGVSLAGGSAAGLWLVTPVVALGLTALVLGYERPALERRFGSAADWRPKLSLPPAGGDSPSSEQRAAALLLVAAPWLILLSAVRALGLPPDRLDAHFSFERAWPVWEWAAPLGASACLAVLLAPFLARTAAQVRRYALLGLLAAASAALIYACLPLVSLPWHVQPRGEARAWVAAEQFLLGAAGAAWPSYRVLWACLVAGVLAENGRAWALVSWSWAALVALSDLAAGRASLSGAAAALVLYGLLARRTWLWRRLLDGAEKLANSWRARRVGPLRIMNHGVFGGLAGGFAVLGAGWLAGAEDLVGVLLIAACSLVGAGVSAQVIEGSPALLRPFGFYGGFAGVYLGAGLTWLLGYPALTLLAAFAMVGPWVQAIGRLRCLVQGCCHGRPTAAWNGIRVREPHSRVCKLAGLTDQPIHATQVYSILSNLVIGSFLIRAWSLHGSLGLIVGLYSILNGLARFVEEAYRGEPQTPVVWGLPIYQYLAILSVLIGVGATLLDGSPAPALAGLPAWPVLVAALLFGIGCWFALGVDFPESERRFARLSG
jgi:hypothetical protein